MSEKGTSKARKSRTICDILNGGTRVGKSNAECFETADSCSEACRTSIVEIRMSLPQLSLVTNLYQRITGFTSFCYEGLRGILMYFSCPRDFNPDHGRCYLEPPILLATDEMLHGKSRQKLT